MRSGKKGERAKEKPGRYLRLWLVRPPLRSCAADRATDGQACIGDPVCTWTHVASEREGRSRNAPVKSQDLTCFTAPDDGTGCHRGAVAKTRVAGRQTAAKAVRSPRRPPPPANTIRKGGFDLPPSLVTGLFNRSPVSAAATQNSQSWAYSSPRMMPLYSSLK